MWIGLCVGCGCLGFRFVFVCYIVTGKLMKKDLMMSLEIAMAKHYCLVKVMERSMKMETKIGRAHV